ncbi:DUF559 domain-containing protein [Sulfurifustis variabilis]|uniref:DUF559 domain-containing protein n=1 Tax=Sulfurifustis variabilis TaxID=1675686 RepID=UPI003B82F274
MIEVDGGRHLNSDTDRTRHGWFTQQEFRVLRFWDNEVLNETAAVLETIAAFLTPLPRPLCSPHPWGSPLRGRPDGQPNSLPANLSHKGRGE